MVVGFANQPIVVGSTGWVTQVKENKCDYETTHHEKKEMEHIFFSHVEEDIHDGIILGDSDGLVANADSAEIIEDLKTERPPPLLFCKINTTLDLLPSS